MDTVSRFSSNTHYSSRNKSQRSDDYDVGVNALNIDMETWNRYTTENSDVFSYVQSEAVEENRNHLRQNLMKFYYLDSGMTK